MGDSDTNQDGVDLGTAARLTGLSVHQIRRWRSMGIVGDATTRLNFGDLRLLRSFAALLRLRLSTRRLNRALERLGAPSNSLTTDGRSLLYRRNRSLWNAETGQGYLDFYEASASTDAPSPAALRRGQDQEHSSLSAEEWYELGASLEHSDVGSAQSAYVKAIHSDPECVPARINLGRLRQLQGQVSAAVHQYRVAIRLDPRNCEAFYNLATVFDDLEESGIAIKYYLQASSGVPEAHLHLGRLLEEQDESMRAKWHFKAWEKYAPVHHGYVLDELNESPSDEYDGP